MKLTIESEGNTTSVSLPEDAALGDLIDAFIVAAQGATYEYEAINKAICEKAEEINEIS